MNTLDHFRLLADYNRWMNDKLYAAAATLPHAALIADRGAFFGSLLGTLGHLITADTIWLKRFRAHPTHPPALAPLDAVPMPTALDATPGPDLPALRQRRELLDRLILDWVGALTGDDLASPLDYASLRGDPFRRPLAGVMLHFFNHQTHHRGQATTLLSQAGVDVGATDLILLIPDQRESMVP